MVGVRDDGRQRFDFYVLSRPLMRLMDEADAGKHGNRISSACCHLLPCYNYYAIGVHKLACMETVLQIRQQVPATDPAPSNALYIISPVRREKDTT